MAGKPFDIALKGLIEHYAPIWPELVGPWPCLGVEVIDADVATVSGASDKALLVHGQDYDWILNLEVQTSHTLDLPERLHLNGTLLERRHGLHVRSAVVLLRRQAEASNLTGVWERRLPDDEVPYLTFRFRVVRVWELPLEPLLTGSLGLLPLAPLTDAAAAQLPAVMQRLKERAQEDGTPQEASTLMASTFILLGLRYSDEIALKLLHGVSTMEESSTYQWIVRQGGLQEAKRILLLQGEKRFGSRPDASIRSTVESLTDLDRIEQLTQRLLDVSTWQDLLN